MDNSAEAIESLDSIVAVATRPLSDNAEQRVSAAGYLESLRLPEGRGEGDAVCRWNEIDGRKRRSTWRIVLWVILLVVSLSVLLSEIPELWVYWQWAASERNRFPGAPDSVNRISSGLSEGGRLLLFGDLEREKNHERKEALWRSEPDNPVYFAEYVRSYSAIGKLPLDFMETVERIDSDNAWFYYFAAVVEGSESERRKQRRRGGKRRRSYEILDQSGRDRAMEWFHQAGQQTRFESYAGRLMQERLKLLKQRNLSESFDSRACLVSGIEHSGMKMRPIGRFIAARAWSIGEAEDESGFKELSADADALLRGMFASDVGMLVDELLYSRLALELAEGLAPVAEKLGIEEEALHWRGLVAELRSRSDPGATRPFMIGGKAEDPGLLVGSLFQNYCFGIQSQKVEFPPVLTDADLKPGRMMDHEILSRFFGLAVWLVMLFGLAWVAIYRFHLPKSVRGLAERVEQLLRPLDWAWILVGGVVFPFVYVMAVNRFTPLGGRDFGMEGTAGLLPLAHFLGLLILWLIVPAQIARLRLARRAGFLGCTRPVWATWLVVLSGLVFVPAIGWVVVTRSFGGLWLEWVGEFSIFPSDGAGNSRAFLWVQGLLVVPVVWFQILLLLAWVGPARQNLQRVTVSRILVPTYAFAMLVMAASLPAFRAAEQYWFERDILVKFDPDLPAWSIYEYRVALQMRKEMREILGFPE